jgi:hypothetical protein
MQHLFIHNDVQRLRLCFQTIYIIYRKYLQGGPLGHGPDRNELLLKRACMLSDLARLAVVVTNYTFESCFTNRLSHLEEGEEVFGFAKQFFKCPHGVDNDSHCLNHVTFSHPRITVPNVVPNNVEDVCMQQSPSGICNLLPLVF